MQFGRYEILESLGHGGMGSVSLACERGAAGGDRLVALKLLHPELVDDPQLVELLTHEATIIARLDHENVVRIFRLGELDRRWFIAMELVQGATLRELIDAAGPLPVDICVGAIAQACRGAHAAHELRDEEGRPLGLVHRDITPHNLMVDASGTVKLLDFGVAFVRGSERGRGAAAIVGKHPYLSPEQAQGQALDRRSDVFALGTVLWEMLAGRRRFASTDMRVNLFAIASGESPAILEARPDVPAPVVEALARALAFESDQRFPTAHAFAGALLDAAVALELEVGERALARLTAAHVGAQMAARAERANALERTMGLPTITTSPASGDGGDDTMVDTEARPPVSAAARSAAARSQPVGIDLPVVATGANFELRADATHALCRVWSRPDLTRAQGAESAHDLATKVLTLLDSPRARGFILDVRDARMVLGGHTLEELEAIFGAAEQRSVRIAALIAADPIQRLDYADLVARTAPSHGLVFEDAAAAQRFIAGSR